MNTGKIQIVLPFNRLQAAIENVLPRSKLLEEKHRSGGFGDTYRVLGPGVSAERSVGIVKVPGGTMGNVLMEAAILANHDDLNCGLNLQDTGFVPKTIDYYPLSVMIEGEEKGSISIEGGDITPHAILREFIYGINVADAIQGDVISVKEFDDMFLKFHAALHEKGYKNTDGQASNFKIDLESDDRRLVLLDTRMGKANISGQELKTRASYVSGGLFGCYRALRGIPREEQIPDHMIEEMCKLANLSPSDLKQD